MSLQQEYSIATALSAAKLTNMGIVGGDNTYISSTLTKRKGQVVLPYDDGALKKFRLYGWDDVAVAWIPLTLPSHTHIDSNDGGELVEAIIYSPNVMIYDQQYVSLGDWQANNSGTGSGVSETSSSNNFIWCQSGTTTTGYADIWIGGLAPSFNKVLRANFVWAISHTSNLLMRLGLGMETLSSASSDNLAKIGFEWCDANANYQLVSANGTTRSLTDSGVAPTTSQDGVKILNLPSLTKVEYKFAGGTTVNKTTNLPSTSPATNNVIRGGIRNNNGGSANREFKYYGSLMVARPVVSAWVV